MKKFAIAMLISGGQTGVDRSALDFAIKQSIPCSGWCPKGRRAEDGRIPEKYPLVEADSELYQQRTRLNVKDSDATLIITDNKRSRGTELTIKCANNYFKPLFIIKSDDSGELEKLLAWLNRFSPQILNVAGPRGSESSAVYQSAKTILSKCLKKTRTKPPPWPPLRAKTLNLF